MEQLEKLTAEQKKIYESLMVYDSVMTSWIDALFFFWFPYCRDKVVAFGAFRCDLHLSGGIRPYVQQTPAASWAS